MRFLAWFEPERAMRGSWLDREHSQWLLRPSGTSPELRYQEKDGFRLLDLGNAEARNWAVEEISHQIREAVIAIYRQDFNLYPAFFWQTNEKTNGVGLNEIHHVDGLYDYLDELARRHPGLIPDNCASGGRRLDFEMMRRYVALWRSDSCWGHASFPRNVQAMTHGLSLWLPLQGLGAAATDEIALRSGMGGCATFAINFRDFRRLWRLFASISSATSKCARCSPKTIIHSRRGVLTRRGCWRSNSTIHRPARVSCNSFVDRRRPSAVPNSNSAASNQPRVTQ